MQVLDSRHEFLCHVEDALMQEANSPSSRGDILIHTLLVCRLLFQGRAYCTHITTIHDYEWMDESTLLTLKSSINVNVKKKGYSID